MAYTFDGPNRLIVLTSGTTTVDAKDLYSRWKDWVADGNAGYVTAFRSIGGDPLGGGVFAGDYYFLNNAEGWRIRPQEANHRLTVNGNLYGEDPDADIFAPTLGAYNVLVLRAVSSLTQTADVGGGGGPSAADIAAAVRANLEAGTPIPVNIEQINNTPIAGTGEVGDSWRPV